MKIRERIAKLIDLKTIVTLSLIITLEFLIIKGVKLEDQMFLLFSNITTMVITFYFAKKDKKEDEEIKQENPNDKAVG
jgi:hypothetical protein